MRLLMGVSTGDGPKFHARVPRKKDAAPMTQFNERTIPVSGANTAEVSRPLRPVIGQTFDAVLFDMDGTLIDSTPAVRRAWFAWCAERGIDPSFLEGAHGQPGRDIVASLVPPEEFDAAFERIQQIEIAEVSDVTVFPGAAEALSAIGENRKAIVTSCTRPLAAARIRASGLVPPRVVVTADDVARGKPHPEPFALGAQLISSFAWAFLLFGTVLLATAVKVLRDARSDSDHLVDVGSLRSVRLISRFWPVTDTFTRVVPSRRISAGSNVPTISLLEARSLRNGCVDIADSSVRIN